MTTPVCVIGGFLGAGKTTALIGLLRAAPDERGAVIVNDFGTARIDDAVIGAETGVSRVAEIAGACVCCTAPSGLVHDLRKLLDEVAPDRVFIEPTGLGRPADIVDTLRRGPLRDRIAVGPVIVVVDPSAVRDARFVDRLRDQLEAADVIVINHMDRADEEALIATDALIATLWPGPSRVVRATRGHIDRDVLAASSIERRAPGADVSTDGFAARSAFWPIDAVFGYDRVRRVIAAAPPSIVRVKGLFRTDEGSFLVERAGAVDARSSQHRGNSAIDVIGTDATACDALIAAVSACALSDAERERSGDAVEIVGLGEIRRFDRAALAALPDGIADVGAVIPGRRGAAARLARLFDALGVPGDAELVLVAVDGLATPATPIAALREGWLVYGVDGGPLPACDGGPLRLLVPGAAAGPCANVKGVSRIVVRGEPSA